MGGREAYSDSVNSRERMIKRSPNGISKEKATEIFALVEKFAGYGFNKAHAAAYGVISYQTAYLKALYPTYFFTAALNLDIQDHDKILIFVDEAKKNGIKI